MNKQVAILRGINVSGQKLIKMEALRQLMEQLGFQDVKTYVQSGNVVFSTAETSSNVLETMISNQLKQEFGFDVPVLVLSGEALNQVVRNNPFVPGKDPSFLHVTFLAEFPEKVDITVFEAKKMPDEALVIQGKTVYLYCPNGYGRTKLNNNFIESKLKVSATTRNWKTTLELAKMVEE